LPPSVPGAPKTASFPFSLSTFNEYPNSSLALISLCNISPMKLAQTSLATKTGAEDMVGARLRVGEVEMVGFWLIDGCSEGDDDGWFVD
jgi:hypothetical protein